MGLECGVEVRENGRGVDVTVVVIVGWRMVGMLLAESAVIYGTGVGT